MPRRPWSIVHLSSELNDYDKTCLKEAHMSLPRLPWCVRCMALQGELHRRRHQQMMLLEHRNLGRLSMGANFGTGPNYIGQHIHKSGAVVHHAARCTFTYTGRKTKRSTCRAATSPTPPTAPTTAAECADGEKFAYVWFELCENGYPGEIK